MDITKKKFNTIQISFLFLCFIAVFVLNSCSDSHDPNVPNEEIKFISKTKLFDYDNTTLASLASLYNKDLGDISPKYSVEVYKVEYYTKKKNQAPLICSGIICIPKTDAKLNGVIAWQHGTMYADSELHNFLSYDILESAISASLGYVSIANDYIGLKSSNMEIQAYHIPEYTVSDFLDLLKAAKNYIRDNNISIQNDLWLAGYSQGAYNVTLIQREWEKNHIDFFNLKEVYAGDGALILSEMADFVFSKNSFDNTALFPPFIRAYNFYYDMNLDYYSIYQPEYADTIDSFYGDTSDVQYRLPTQLNKLFTETFINDIKVKTGDFYLKMKNNNLNNFSPKCKLNIFHSRNDEIIPYEIGEHAYQYYSSVGGNVELIPASAGGNHRDNILDFLIFTLNDIIKK